MYFTLRMAFCLCISLCKVLCNPAKQQSWEQHRCADVQNSAIITYNGCIRCSAKKSFHKQGSIELEFNRISVSKDWSLLQIHHVSVISVWHLQNFWKLVLLDIRITYYHQNSSYKIQLRFREKSTLKQDNTWEMVKVKLKPLQLSTCLWDIIFSSGN